MLDCKLQIGCTLVLLFIMGVYYRSASATACAATSKSLTR